MNNRIQYQVPFNSEVTHSTVLLSAAGWAIDYLVGKTNLRRHRLGPLYCAHVLQLDLKGATGTIDGAKVSGPSLSRQLLGMRRRLPRHPAEAPRTGPDPRPASHRAILLSRRGRQSHHQRQENRWHRIQDLTLLTVGGVAFQAWSMVFDQIVTALSPENVSAATLTLDALGGQTTPRPSGRSATPVTATGGGGAVTTVSDLDRDGWASACAVNSITGDTDCTTFFKLDHELWTALGLDWDACAEDLAAAGAPSEIANELAKSCPTPGPQDKSSDACQRALSNGDLDRWLKWLLMRLTAEATRCWRAA